MTAFDQDALVASIDLVRRAGATQLEFGYLNDDVPVERADWWAHAQYRGARVTVEHRTSPVEAVEGLALQLLDGAQCRRCAKPIVLADDKAGCRWTRNGRSWTPGCGKPINHDIPARR